MINKNQIFFFFFLLINIFYEANGQNSFNPIWAPINKLYKDQTLDINFDSSGHMFICGDKMYISSDTGKTGDIIFDKTVYRIFIGPDNTLYATTPEGFFKYESFNSSWIKIEETIPWAVAFEKDGKIFTGSQEGLFYSYSGTGWTQVTDFGLDSVGITGFCLDSLGNIYAGGFQRESSPYVIPSACLYRSRDSGATWRKLPFPDSLKSSVFSSEIIVTKDKKIFYNMDAGTFVSQDDGETWEPIVLYYEIPQFGLHREYFSRLYLFNDTIYAVSFSRLWMSTDSGNSWNILFDGSNFDGSSLGLFCFGITNSGQFFLGTTNGIFLSPNRGETWEGTLNVNTVIPALCFTIGWQGQYFVGTENGIYLSKDDGDTWQQSGLKGIRVIDIGKSPRGSILTSTADSVLYISNDTAKTWKKIGIDTVCLNNPFAGLIAIDSTGSFFYTYENILFKSSDDGKSWTKCLENSIHTFQNILITKEQNIFTVLDTGRIIQSNDGGLSWNNADSGIPPYTIPQGLIECGKYLFTIDGGIYRTSKDKINWQPVGLEDNYYIEKITADSKENLYAFVSLNDGTGKKEIYRTMDFGNSWQLVDFTFSDDLVFIEIEGEYIYAITSNGNVLKSKNPVTSIINNRNLQIQSYLLSQNYPNPFNPSTRINYELPVLSKVIIKIYDILGREVTTLLNETKNPGKYEVIWNAANYTSGVYFYTIKAESIVGQNRDFYDAKKLILLK